MLWMSGFKPTYICVPAPKKWRKVTNIFICWHWRC